MDSAFTADFFVQNRQRLRMSIGGEQPIVITASGVVQRTADTTYPFSQDRNFWYLTGSNEPDLVLVMLPEGDFLILPKSNAMRDVFDGVIDREMLTLNSGVQDITSYNDGWNRVKAALGRYNEIYTLLPGLVYEPHYAMYLNPARRRLVTQLRRAKKAVALRDLRTELAQLRASKQPQELAAIERAIAITCQTIEDVRHASVLQTFSHEYQLEAAITQGFRSRGATGHAYSPIVASGTNATTLHYVSNSQIIGSDELIVVDVGAEVDGYAADITRTISKSPLSQRQADIIDAVKAVQTEALLLLKPGLHMKEYEDAVVAKMGKQLKQLGLINNQNDEAAIRHYYPHASSHFLGLDVHDVGRYEEPLEENMVLTCEPGIYVPEERIGVRIEDDILVTASGCRNLSGHCAYEAYAL